MEPKEKEPRTVSLMLGARAKIGPLPAELVFPWAVISLGIFFACQLLQIRWIWIVILIGWGDISWWVLTGSAPWRFLSKFISVPRWAKGYLSYSFLLKPEIKSEKRSRSSRTKSRTKFSKRPYTRLS